MALPAEIWAQIFHLAAEEDEIFQYGLPTSLDTSVWVRNTLKDKLPENSDIKDWTLRSPGDMMNLMQRRSYSTKKAIISTCKSWYNIGQELLFRCLFFYDAPRLISLCEILDSSSSTASTISSSIGWWTRRIHIARFHASASRGTTMADLEAALVRVIKHCPNLEVFIVDWPMGATFGAVADALVTHTATALRAVHWSVAYASLPEVIWALAALPSLIAAHVHVGMPTVDDDGDGDARLGAAAGVHLALPRLQQLTLRGYVQELVEQAAGWALPLLRSLTVDSGALRTDLPDVVGFLERHGARLVFLDLNCIPPLDVRRVLDLCPRLAAFCFNADWRIQQPGEELPAPSGSNTMGHAAEPQMSALVNGPHLNVEMVGLHGLMYAFGVGLAADVAVAEPLMAHIIRRSNDLNVAALNRVNFPKLRFVRALSRPMLSELNEADGPSTEDGGMDRYDRWWDLLGREGVRFEDCTGEVLGTLPMDGDEESEESDEEEEEEEYEEEDGEEWESDGEYEDDEEYEDDDEYEDEWEFDIPPMPQEGGAHVDELRQLLEECRAMAEEREEPLFPPAMMMPMGPSY